MKIFDISPVISSRLGVFPGDIPFERKISLDFKKGHHLQLSSITSTLHLGAHTDAPGHYAAEGEGIATRDLHFYLGKCQVISVISDLQSQGETTTRLITVEDLQQRGVRIEAKRVLFRTHSFPQPEQWNADFWALSPALIEFLAQEGVILVGLDTPSVDPEDSKSLESHSVIFKNDMAILEGVVLDQVPDGLYTLIALPLKLEEADASPVRAILLSSVYDDLL